MLKKYAQALGIWCLIVPLAILNGGLREYVLVGLGKAALPLSGVILSACILAVALWLIPKIKNCTRQDYLAFGAIWFLLTNFFDLRMILAEGGGLSDLLALYDVTAGNLWLLVVIVTALAPYLAAKWRHKI